MREKNRRQCLKWDKQRRQRERKLAKRQDKAPPPLPSRDSAPDGRSTAPVSQTPPTRTCEPGGPEFRK
jgi:hypothetical protein